MSATLRVNLHVPSFPVQYAPFSALIAWKNRAAENRTRSTGWVSSFEHSKQWEFVAMFVQFKCLRQVRSETWKGCQFYMHIPSVNSKKSDNDGMWDEIECQRKLSEYLQIERGWFDISRYDVNESLKGRIRCPYQQRYKGEPKIQTEKCKRERDRGRLEIIE